MLYVIILGGTHRNHLFENLLGTLTISSLEKPLDKSVVHIPIHHLIKQRYCIRDPIPVTETIEKRVKVTMLGSYPSFIIFPRRAKAEELRGAAETVYQNTRKLVSSSSKGRTKEKKQFQDYLGSPEDPMSKSLGRNCNRESHLLDLGLR
ncbi:unnamed protein product [Microthlaspi erraticum]|uniref:Uncharacterized protein n=1 Tax=Microthlaspi erraticum TaxID=1685480 RepID=A0A6D2IY76_9BRAS|nr:unnamed protein product [Microthlaspi erraticum]